MNIRNTLMMASSLIAAVFATSAVQAQDRSEGRVYMMMTPITVTGSADIENGAISEGIRKSLKVVDSRSRVHRATAFTNLCIGYAKKADFNTALTYCDKAVNEDRFETIARVNRGAVHYMMGNYSTSLTDLELALSRNTTLMEAKKNLSRAERNYAALQQGRPNLAEAK